jgi:outer membrane protein TolC
LRVPLFEGGRVQGRIAQSRAAVEQQRARVADLRARVELEVRTSLLDMAAASRQVEVASGARALAEQQLALSRDRFANGVASSIEVVQAQQALAEASESYSGSLLAHNLAKLAMARALGVVESQAMRYLGGGA